MRYVLIAMVLGMAGCSSNKYFIVRHAEKAAVPKDSINMMANNPPLSEAGKVRAYVLRDELKNENIQHIFSTNTIRTISTAQPLKEGRGAVTIELYSSSKDSIDVFISKLRTIKKNVLVVGHSNTVDDLVNKLCGRTEVAGDLGDGEYNNLFIVKRKGKRMIFQRRKYGYPSNPE